jgi:predicted naringenin-chalcone synthase
LFSDTSAAAVTCAIMKPEFTPLFSTRKAGRPLIFGSTSTAMRRSERLPISAIASASVSAAKATGSA